MSGGPRQPRATRLSSEQSGELPTVPPVGMAGDFPQRITVVPGSTTSLILASASEQISGRPVLVPFVDLKISGLLQSSIEEETDEESFETLLSSTLPAENAVFLAFDMTRDLKVALQQLAASGEKLGLEPQRLKLARAFAEQLVLQAGGLRDVLDRLVSGAEARLFGSADEAPAPPPENDPLTDDRAQVRRPKGMRVGPKTK